MKKIRYFIIALILLFISSINVSADTSNIVDFNKKGSISITLKESNEEIPVENAEIAVLKIAKVTDNNNNLFYEFTEELKECSADLTNLKDVNLTTEILKCIKDKDLTLIKEVTNKEGTATFKDLDLGLYLVMQTNAVKGYSKIDEFLITIPKESKGTWTYEIVAQPKVDIIRLFDLTVEKVWGVSNNIPEKVTIELLKKGEVIDTIELNEENNWTYTWEQIEKSDEYSVREINIPIGYTASYRSEGNKFIVTNTKTLVQTGQETWITLLLAILGLSFIIIGFVTEKRNKYE